MTKTPKQISGEKGEKQALDYLKSKDFSILERNYRYKKAEIDIIAKNELFIVFVEVKLRKNNVFGHPEETVTDRKIELFQEAAEHYIEENLISLNLRFDIIAITGNTIQHFEDAF